VFTTQNTYICKRGKHHKLEDDILSNVDAFILRWCLEHTDRHSNYEVKHSEDGICIVKGFDGLL
jgi:hypothetical protein